MKKTLQLFAIIALIFTHFKSFSQSQNLLNDESINLSQIEVLDNNIVESNTDKTLTVCALSTNLGIRDLLSTSVRVYWDCIEQYSEFELQYKPTTSATWTTVSNIQSDTDGFGRSVFEPISISNLLPNTTYQWRVKTICVSGDPSVYSNGTNFTTICPVTNFLAIRDLLSTSVGVYWECVQQYASFELQYKPTTSATWTTVSNIQSDTDGFGRSVFEPIAISNLLPNTTYQWRVKTICASGDPSVYSNGTNFTTICPVTNFLAIRDLLSTSVGVYWECVQQYASFELQYKPTTSATWTTVSNIQSDTDGFGRSVFEPISISNLLPNTTYQWRVKTICASGDPSVYSNGTNFTTICPVTNFLAIRDLLSTSVGVYWECVQQYASFELQYKPTTSATWTTVSNIQSDTDGFGRSVFEPISISNLLPNTTYQWRVKTICASGDPSAYVNGINFTTLCAAPSGLGNGNTTLTSTDLIWLSVSAGISYEVRYRVAGSNTNWVTQTVNAPTVTPNSTITYSISGLTPQTTYEWQVRTLCSPLTTAFSSLATFTTSCPIPTNLASTNITTNSAVLNWNIGLVGATSDLQWRLVGSTTWTTVTGLTTGSYTLTGLSVGLSYQWQVRTNCSVTVNSSYSTPITFITACPLPFNLSTVNLTPTSVQLNWSVGFSGGTYSVQWRPQNGNYTTVNNLTSPFYNLTGLTAGTIYEWQVKLFCTPTATNVYAGPSTFTTPNVCSSMYSIRNGSWDDPSVWSCNRIPNNTDIVLIKNVITVPVGYVAQSQQIIYDQGPTVRLLQSAQLISVSLSILNESLQGTWAYPNGAELYYDGSSATAKGTKVPTNNIFGFVVGEDYWQDLNSIGNDKWTVMQILRSTAGTKFYSPTTITKLSATSIEIDISGFGKEILTKK